MYQMPWMRRIKSEEMIWYVACKRLMSYINLLLLFIVLIAKYYVIKIISSLSKLVNAILNKYDDEGNWFVGIRTRSVEYVSFLKNYSNWSSSRHITYNIMSFCQFLHK